MRKLVIAEKLTVLPAVAASHLPAREVPVESKIARDLRTAWDLAVLSNHHDFITGTSPIAFGGKSNSHGSRKPRTSHQRWHHSCHPTRGARVSAEAAARFQPRGRRAVVQTDAYRVELNEQQGGAIQASASTSSGQDLLSGPANDLVSYRDSGGLWRLGHEFRGGSFVECARASQEPARIRVKLRDDCSKCVSTRSGRASLFAGSGCVTFAGVAHAPARFGPAWPDGHLSIPTELRAQSLTMDVPGGIVERPAHKLFRPTFWPARSFVHLRDGRSDVGWPLSWAGPPPWPVTAREPSNGLPCATRLARPHFTFFQLWPTRPRAASRTRGNSTTPYGSPRPEMPGAIIYPTMCDGHCEPRSWSERAGPGRPGQFGHAGRPRRRQVTALKPAFRGDAIVARLTSFAPGAIEVRLSCPSRPIRRASLCDARERELRGLELRGSAAIVPMPHALASVLVWL